MFLKEQKIAFYADAFRRLDNGNYLFNATPNGKRVAGLILTDSLMNPIREFMPYPEGYVGGCNTSNIFRTKGGKTAFYRSPSDTVTIFNGNGEIKSLLVFDFSDKAIPEKAKIDYLAFRRSRHSSSYIRLVDNPITVSDSLWIGLAEDGESQYTIFFNPTTGQCGCRKLSKSSSAYDMIEPMFSDGDNSIVSLLSAELENLCKDYKSLPDSVTEALNDGNRVLMVNGF